MLIGCPAPPRLPAAVVKRTFPITPAVETVVLPEVPELVTARESDSGTASPGIETCKKKEEKINN